MFLIFFRKIYMKGIKEMRPKRRTILAVNHPTAFLDPAMIGSFSKPTQNFLLRGDVFSSPVTRWLLRQIHTIPIFRFRDGFSSLKNNQSTFEYCYDLLKQKEYLLVLAEGQTKFEKRLRPIQKGTARMAFGAYEKYQLDDIEVLPVGVNYTDAAKSRSVMMVEVGTAIPLSNYMEAYQENPRKAIKQMTDEISRQLKNLVVHVQADEDAQFADQVLDIHRNDLVGWSNWPVLEHSNVLLRAEVQLAKQINQLPEERKAPLREKCSDYFHILKNKQLRDDTLMRPKIYNWLNSLILLLTAIPALIGYAVHYPAVWLSRNIADGKVKRKEFYTSIRYGVMLFGTLFYYLLFLLPIGLLLIGKASLLVLPLLLLMGYGSIHWRELYDRWLVARRYVNLSREERENLQSMRQLIIDEIKQLKAAGKVSV